MFARITDKTPSFAGRHVRCLTGNVKGMSTFPLSGFADEISPSLSVQLSTLKRLNIGGLDLRSVDGVNVLDLTDDQIERVRFESERCGIRVQCVGSPVNKVDLSEEGHRAEVSKLRRAIEIAHRLGTRRIRIFSPRTSDGDAAMRAMSEMASIAADEDVVLIHENDADFWGAYPENARRLFEELGSPHFRAAFDFANTVLLGFRPMDDWFPWLLPHLDTLHIKDAKDGRVVPAGQGDGQMRETLEFLIEQGWSGPLTLEPHLAQAAAMGGFSGEERFEVATVALRELVQSVGGTLE